MWILWWMAVHVICGHLFDIENSNDDLEDCVQDSLQDVDASTMINEVDHTAYDWGEDEMDDDNGEFMMTAIV